MFFIIVIIVIYANLKGFPASLTLLSSFFKVIQ